jgi:hypothetical protein
VLKRQSFVNLLQFDVTSRDASSFERLEFSIILYEAIYITGSCILVLSSTMKRNKRLVKSVLGIHLILSIEFVARCLNYHRFIAQSTQMQNGRRFSADFHQRARARERGGGGKGEVPDAMPHLQTKGDLANREIAGARSSLVHISASSRERGSKTSRGIFLEIDVHRERERERSARVECGERESA